MKLVLLLCSLALAVSNCGLIRKVEKTDSQANKNDPVQSEAALACRSSGHFWDLVKSTCLTDVMNADFDCSTAELLSRAASKSDDQLNDLTSQGFEPIACGIRDTGIADTGYIYVSLVLKSSKSEKYTSIIMLKESSITKNESKRDQETKDAEKKPPRLTDPLLGNWKNACSSYGAKLWINIELTFNQDEVKRLVSYFADSACASETLAYTKEYKGKWSISKGELTLQSPSEIVTEVPDSISVAIRSIFGASEANRVNLCKKSDWALSEVKTFSKIAGQSSCSEFIAGYSRTIAIVDGKLKIATGNLGDPSVGYPKDLADEASYTKIE